MAAGCTGPDGGPGLGDAQQLTAAEGRQLLESAVEDMPDRFGIDMRLSRDGQELATIKGSFDNASGVHYLEFKGDPAAFGEEAGEESGAELFAAGIAIYSSPEGSLYLVNGTAYVFPPSEGDEEDGGFIPRPEESPLGDFLDPGQSFDALEESNVTVKSIRPVTYRGQSAIEMVVEGTDEDGERSEATVVLFRDPARLAHMEMTMPSEDEDDSALAGANATVDFYYGDEVQTPVPPSVQRATGLLYESDKSGFSFGDDGEPTTWTFRSSAGIALDEVEVQVKGEAAEDESDDSATPDLRNLPTLWSMTLSEGEKTQDGVTLTFTDADGDGKVSAGDTLVIAHDEGAEAPTVALYDTVTETYVVPGPGLAALLVGLLALALLVRRK